jgi:succinate dehydrogenase / fumarate reductase, membrane anchor subunit
MVNKLTTDMSLTGNGLRDWLIQRFSSLIIGLYFIVLSIFFLSHGTIDYAILRNLFASTRMQIFTLITLISVFLHAWVGVWTVITDYVKPIALRLIIQVVVIVALAIYFFWGIAILWKLI